MEDAELQAIRKARLAELQKNSGQSEDSSAKSSLQFQVLGQVLEPQARERLSRVNMVRPDRAKAVENYLVKLSQSGQLRRKLTEAQLVEILNGLAKDSDQGSKIIFDRKNAANSYGGESDEDDFFD